MTPEQLHILQHSLGLDEYGRGTGHRNHFVTGEGSTNHPTCMSLVELGHMEIRRAKYEPYGGDDVFAVTEGGCRAVAAESPAPPKLTRSQQNYRDFLAYDGGCTFIEYLTMRARIRRQERESYL